MDALTVALVGLGGIYFLSKDDKNKHKESFQTKLNTDTPQSYPIKSDNVQLEDEDYVNKYRRPNQTTDKFFKNVEKYSEIMDTTPVNSLTGNIISQNDFKHNNMVPFFGSKLTGINVDQNSQLLLDNLNGSGSQINKKAESAPLFKPQKDMEWNSGAPNNSDYFQSHQYISNIKNNTKPWQEKHIGPGLGGPGYNLKGSGGFNSGMEARNCWQPKTVDELRILNNPKTVGTLDGLEGPAESKIVNRGIEGKIEKNRPDTDFEWGQDRLFTTTGLEIKPTARSNQEIGHTNRPETSVEHYGTTGSLQQTHSAPKTYQELSLKPHCYVSSTGGAYANSKYTSGKNDFGIETYNMTVNNRNTTASASEFGPVGSAIGSIVAPILDVLKPSRKENVLGNLREAGNVQNQSASYILNPGDKPKTTIKEMTLGTKNHLNIQSQNNVPGSYTVTNTQVVENQRETTSTENYGNANSNVVGANQIGAYLEQRNNHKKNTREFTPAGNNSLLNHYTNVELSNKYTNSIRQDAPNLQISQPPGINTYGETNCIPKTISPPSDYLDPSLLDAFKKNPYTQSLESY